jgi:hypothetical protein
MMSNPLHGDQWPKGLTEEQVREIVREETVDILGKLRDAVANTPQRGDGNMNARDFYDTLDILAKGLQSTGEESDADSQQEEVS